MRDNLDPIESSIIKRSVVIAGHKTSVSLEDDFWGVLKEIANQRGTTLSGLVTSIKADRHMGNLSSAIRLFVLMHIQNQISGHLRQGQSDAAPAI